MSKNLNITSKMSTKVFENQNKAMFFNNLVLIVLITSALCDDFCDSDSECHSKSDQNRYIFYDVNPPEGFNLRRDVYMRFALLAHKLKNSKDELRHFKLVLPPWSHLYHWKRNLEPEHIPWGLFFDLESLKSFAPVIEMYEFFQMTKQTYSVTIDETYVLQHFEEMFESGKFQDKIKIQKCLQKPQLNYFFYKNITSKNVKCLSYHGPATKLTQVLSKTSAKSIFFHHAEVALHDMFGSKLYWESRRSMRFNKELRKIASDFRKKKLNSTDESDLTILPEKWQDEKPHRDALGGPYLAVHIRRKDFLRGRINEMPSITSLAKQITKFLTKQKLNQVFIATDAPDDEYNKIVSEIPPEFKSFRYKANDETGKTFKEGGIAIIEQIICSCAQFFVGTYESTFSFRIQEEREILGFPSKTTFNSFCKDDSHCPQPSVWKIVY